MLNKNMTRLLSLLGTMLFLAGCAASVSVKTNIPQPLIGKLPLTGHLLYTDEFKNYRYKELEKKRSLSSLSFGPAQQDLFDRIFSQLITVSGVDDASLDVVIEPEILDFQYASPKETKLNLYEVWLRYRVKITDSKDNTLADWVIKGYGKSPTATLKTASSAFNSAMNVALRDVGAQLAIGFAKQPAIQDLLTQKQVSQSPQSSNPKAVVPTNIEAW